MPMRTVSIRPATVDDVPALVEVIQQAFAEYRGRLDPPSGAHAENAETIARLLQNNEHAFLAHDEETSAPLGCVFCTSNRQLDDTFYLHRLAVIPQARGEGIATMLVHAVEEFARAAERTYVTLGVRIALTANRTFYLKRGYYPVAYGAHPGFHSPTFVTMRKRVAPPVPRQVLLVPWTPEWAAQYASAAAEVTSLLGDNLLAIHHIGSTAIPHMPAKPTIDVLAVVTNIMRVDRAEQSLLEAGWQPRGENGIAGRRYFRKGSDALHTHHLHIYPPGHAQIERQLRFVAYLSSHPEEAERYATCKQKLAAEHPFDPVSYTEGKGPLVEELLQRALT